MEAGMVIKTSPKSTLNVSLRKLSDFYSSSKKLLKKVS